MSKRAKGDKDGKTRQRRGKIHEGAETLGGWSDAAHADQSTTGKCRLGYVIGLMSSTLRGPRHIIQWTSKFTRKLAKCSLGGEVYAFSEMAGRIPILRGFYAHCMDIRQGMACLQDCESVFTRLKNKKIIAGKFLIRHFLASQQALETQETGNEYWLPGLGNPRAIWLLSFAFRNLARTLLAPHVHYQVLRHVEIEFPFRGLRTCK